MQKKYRKINIAIIKLNYYELFRTIKNCFLKIHSKLINSRKILSRNSGDDE